MKALQPLWREAALLFWRWQARTIHPLSPYLPQIVLTINQIESRR